MQSGNASEKLSLLKEMLKEDVVGVFLRYMRHQLCMMRSLAVNSLRALADAFLGLHISSDTAGEIIELLCDYALQGPETFIRQMLDPATAWQSAMFMGKTDISPEVASKGAPRIHAMVQNSGMWTVHGILHTFPIQPRSFCLDILKKRPQILDLLLDCAILNRPPVYPETQVPATACEVLCLLLDWSDYIVPGLSPPVPTVYKTSESRDLKVMAQALSVLTSRQDWSEKLIEVWMHIEEEDMETVRRHFTRHLNSATTTSPPGESEFAKLFTFRTTCRVSILRLIASLTHASQTCGVNNVQIESLLHLAYRGCHDHVKRFGDADTEEAAFARLEYDRGIFHYPAVSQFQEKPVGIPFIVLEQTVLGPIALIRLLVVLAQRSALAGVQALRKAPPGLSPSTSLKQVKQITHPDIIRRAITISQERILAQIQRGRKQLLRGKDGGTINLTGAMFASAAELALALIALDTYTDGAYTEEVRGVRKQLVIALGNAAQIALNLSQYQRALHFASGAVGAAEDISEDEGLDPAIIEKNKRRASQALAALQRHT
ncbi:hypothetical protein CONPUDRAFT_164456 [Coniophora puteana RWD-64-598 SS2]|uniref:Uncharacterized protein n=1 Tax=Coniophora puteana (strain RWD-64-598) TaxID=741705 RepID=A0A5M3MX22_CONPW|nr:uncharacterized protein CONPUDRAFT_164456 [Coniophora puteana RWD-64-598 SS2]EIW83537.1 hypothetical protein CONPUDRAFT_164456 [Coniophora puteana RWD-64-598 SS2]